MPVISRTSVLIFLAMAIWPALTGRAMAVSADEPIAGYAPATAAQLEAELSMRNPGHIHPGIAQYYADWGPRFGIRCDVAFAQMLHETDSLRYGGVVQPRQNNFAGIGAFDAQHPGYSWPSAEAGVIGHYAHLAWFIFPNHINAYCNTAWDPGHGNHRNSVHTIRGLGGQWAVPGTGYGEALARYATEIYNFTPGGHWKGNFNEVTGMPAFALSTVFNFPWYDSKPANGMGGNWIIIGNQGTDTATVEIWIGMRKMRDPEQPGNDFFTIPEGGRVAPQFPDIMGGPVKVVSVGGQPLTASQRVLYRETFNEVQGIPAERLTDTYEFTWYDSRRAGYMFGDWLLISNQGGLPADVEVWVGAMRLAEFSAANGNALAPGAVITPMFSETVGGPVRVVSTNHQPLVTSQRVLFQESFSEVMGYPAPELASRYFFSWYDSARNNGMRGDWILVANRGSADADVEVYIGELLMAAFTAKGGNPIPPGGMVTPLFAGVTAGPVEVVCTNGQPILASQRVVFRDGFEEVQGTPDAGLTADLFFPWYDSRPENNMTGDWLIVTNRGVGDARVEVWVGDTKMRDPEQTGNDFFTIPEGGRITPQFAGVMGGPLRVLSVSGQPLLAGQRVLYKYNVAACGGAPCG